MKTKVLDLERELILRIEEQEEDETIWLDFFTEEGLKTIKMRKDSLNKILTELKRKIEENGI